MTRAGLFGAAAACLLLGVADLGALNLWLAPQVWPPGPGAGDTPEVPDAPRPTPLPEGGATPADSPALDEPAVDEPAVEEPVVEEPVVEEPVVEEPVVEEPVVEEPVVEEPVVEEPPAAVPSPPPAVEEGGVDVGAVLREPLVLHFDPGSSEMRAGGRRGLSSLAKKLKGQGGLRLVVEGHTDDTGTEQVNERLGAQRARVVAKYLERRLGARIEIDHRGFGSVRPADPGSGPAARARNRRVEVKLVIGEP